MHKMIRMIAAFLPVVFLMEPATAISFPADDEAFQRREAAWQDFSNWDKAVGISSKVFQDFAGSDETEAIFDDYGNAVLVISISKELLHSGNLQAALVLIKDKLQDALIKEITPDFHAWLGWITWAKAGMELYKDVVFDPMVESSQINTYIGLRKAGNEPEDAFAGVRGYGYIVERAKKEFRKQYGDGPFQKDSNELLPAWEAQFLQFAKAGMESKYLEKVHKELLATFQARAAAAAARLPELREQVLLLLRQKTVSRIKIEPAVSEIHVGEQVVLEAIAIFADPSAPRSAEEVTADCAWKGAPGDNVYTAQPSDVGRTITITAEYLGLVGTATVKVLQTDCGDHGRWNEAAGQCDCDSGYVWNQDLGECVPRDLAGPENIKEVLVDMESRFYEAVQSFNTHYDNFVAGLQAQAGRRPEEICANANLAFSFTRAAAAYDIVESYYVEALDKVGRSTRGLNWEAIAAGNYEPDIHVLDQIRLEMFRKEYQKVSENGENLPTLLAQYAPGCDPEEMIALGGRTAETDQNAESGIDTGDFDGATGSGGGTSSGELRLARIGEPAVHIDNLASCSGGSMTLKLNPPVFPSVIHPGDVVVISVSFNWTVTGSKVSGIDIAAVLFFGDQTKESQHFSTYSGSRTQNFTFTATPALFQQPGLAIGVTVGGSLSCDGGSSDQALVQYTQGYVRAGSK